MSGNSVASNAVQQRERRVVIGGAVVTLAGLLLAWVVVPYARSWMAREAEIRQLRQEVAVASGLVAAAPQLESASALGERALSERARRVFHARSTALAASALQSLLQDAADASHLVVTRLDVAQESAASDGTTNGPTNGTTNETAGATSLPATLAAYCDVVGLAALLDQLARAPRVVVVERLTVQQNSALRGAPDMLQVTLLLRAPVIVE